MLGSGSVPHYSGKGAYNLEALTAFQEFPKDYLFAGTQTQVRKQIGNAVPAKSFAAYATEIRHTLEDIDSEKQHPRCSIFNANFPFRTEDYASELLVID